jgi:hypothetical protein
MQSIKVNSPLLISRKTPIEWRQQGRFSGSADATRKDCMIPILSQNGKKGAKTFRGIYVVYGLHVVYDVYPVLYVLKGYSSESLIRMMKTKI